jgi:eukaryotic-like serine/threonine-protein kinase
MPNLSDEQWRAFSDALDQALELPESERAAWLAALNAADRTVAEEVERSLATRQRQDFAAFLSEAALPGTELPRATLTGRHVGPYVIESEIGHGGMGSVWRARRTDGRYEGVVAIKLLHAHWLSRDGEQRFRIEGRLLAQLDHPNIARLIDAGVMEGSQPYLVLEYVEGEPIDAYCERLGLGTRARVALFQEVLAAVGHAHSHLIIHRDLKPANVLAADDGSVKLLDFGVAKLLTPETHAARTQTTAQALTPQYAAPEQLLGQPVTTATDVYALGLMLYVLLTGEHPVPADGRSGAALVHAVVTEEPRRPSQVERAPPATRRALQGDLDNIIGKALRKDPGARYGSVAAFSEDLRRFLADEPVLARRDTVPYRVAKFVRRNRGSVVGGLLIALGLIGTSAFALLQMRAAREQRDAALQQAKLASAQTDLTQYILDDKLSRLSPDAERQRLDRARQFLEARFREDPLLAARLLIDISGWYVDSGDFTDGAAAMVQAESIGHRLDDAGVLGQIACLRSEDLTIAGKMEQARTQFAAGLAQMRRLKPIPWALEAECASAGAFVDQADGNYAGAVNRLRGAVASLDAQGLHGSGRQISLSNDLGRAFSAAGMFHEAYAVDDANVEQASTMGRADTNAWLVMVTNACFALRSGGQPLRAVAYLDAHTAALRREHDYSDMPYHIQGCRAVALLLAGRIAEAEPGILAAQHSAQQGGVTFQAASLQAFSVTAALARGDLAAAELRWAQMAPDLEHRLAQHEKGAPIVRLLLVSAQLANAQGRAAEALKSLQTARQLIASRAQPVNADASEVEALSSSTLLALHRYAAAGQRARAALELAQVSAVDPRSSAWMGQALVLEAQAEAAAGNPAAAASAARQALTHLVPNLDPAHPLIAQAQALATPAAQH